MIRLLLISNSVQHGRGFLDHCAEEIVDFLSPHRSLVFVPYALQDWDAYTLRVADRLSEHGFKVRGVHENADPVGILQHAEAILVGGGNTFRLLNCLHRFGLLDPIRQRVRASCPYVGSSAGTNVACPTIQTTNDMPIVYPPSFEALALVPFNINPHYLDPDPGSTHQGETREQRIREFHEMNDQVVVGLREGTWLRREGAHLRLGGQLPARVFQKGKNPEEFMTASDLSSLLEQTAG